MPDRVLRTKIAALYTAWEQCKRQGRQHCDQQLVHAAVHELLEFLLSAYPGEVTLAEVRGLLAERSEYSLISTHLVPIAVMRDVVNQQRVAFDPQAVDNWKLFAARYGHFIIAA